MTGVWVVEQAKCRLEAVVSLVVRRHAGARGVGSQQRAELWMEGHVEKDPLV
jgi:hypothetical protein